MKVIWQDFAVSISLVANQIARYITITVTTTLKGLTSSANYVEANPIQRLLLDYQAYQTVVLFATYGLILAGYLLLRRNALNKPKDQGQRLALDVFTLVLLMIFIGDMLNDLSILAGVLIH